MQKSKISIKNRTVRVLKEDGKFDFTKDHCNAMIIQNSGDVDAMINENWTFKAGATLQLGSQTDVNQYADEIRVSFDSESEGVNPRVEVLPLSVFACQCQQCKTLI